MIKEVRLKGWKSILEATLYIDPLTIMIGTNASGKSNVLDALEFLNRLSKGLSISIALSGDQTIPPIRGGVEWAVFRPSNKQFSFEIILQSDDENFEYIYSISITIDKDKQKSFLSSESLARKEVKKKVKQINIFEASLDSLDSPSISVTLYNGKSGEKKYFKNTHSILSQMSSAVTLQRAIIDSVEFVSSSLSQIFILDPIPSKMRSYTHLEDYLRTDASNISGFLASFPKKDLNELMKKILNSLKRLPERDIKDIWVEKVGKFETDAMLYCEENWISKVKQTTIVDARSMSDGTLRFLAILVALLTRPERSLIIIEEIDNGLHPSRSSLLLKTLKNISSERKIDILVTTHNPSLLDLLAPEFVSFIVVSHRDLKTGSTKLTQLDEIENLPKMLASGNLGKIVSDGAIEESFEAEK
jgi:AAA15 family ATPase/GTPase